MFRVPLRSFLRSAPERLRRPSQRYWDVQKKGLPFTKKAALFKNSPSQNPRKTLFIAPLLKNQRSVDSCKCKIIAHNILCIHLATFTTNVVQIATFRVNVIQVQCWMEPAYNRRTVKNERAQRSFRFINTSAPSRIHPASLQTCLHNIKSLGQI